MYNWYTVLSHRPSGTPSKWSNWSENHPGGEKYCTPNFILCGFQVYENRGKKSSPNNRRFSNPSLILGELFLLLIWIDFEMKYFWCVALYNSYKIWIDILVTKFWQIISITFENGLLWFCVWSVCLKNCFSYNHFQKS